MLLDPYSDFFRGAFQIGFVTNDLDRAIEIFGERYGVDFLRVGVDTKAHFHGAAEAERLEIECALANVGTTQIEIIEPHQPTPLYSDVLPPSGFAIRPHHHGFLVPGGDAGWAAFRKAISAAGRKIALESVAGHHLNFLYLDERDVCGQFFEYVSDTPNFHKALLRPPAN